MSKGINKAVILREAEVLLKKKGLERLSLREIATSLDIKPASLYNHIVGISEVHEHLAEIASKKLKAQLENAMADKDSDEAFLAGASAYRSFADKNRELYKVLISARSSSDKKIKRAGFDSFSPIRDVILSYNISETDRIHFVRIFRAYLHGFIENTYNGFMQKGSVSKDETFNIGLKGFLQMLRGLSDNA